MAANRKILDLRNVLAERFLQQPNRSGGRLITGITALDQATDGGLRKGHITEISSSQPSAGSALLIHSLLQLARRDRSFIALIDGCDSFDVQTAGQNALRHLLWVRCQKTTEAIKASDFLLRDGNFPLVILDLILNPAEELRRIPATSWYRLQRLVEAAPSAFLVMSRHNLVASAHTKIVLNNQWTLSDLSHDEPLSQLRLDVRRAQGQVSALG
ncbi:MAG: recombination protein RecA [Verrucomicrobiota bacterium]